MLNRLVIRNYALIDNLDIKLDRHLNIITGETGAGKSIILGALGLILGSRVENRYFYDSTKKCVIEGFFDIESYNLSWFFDENDLDVESETIIRREIAPDGRSRAFINDTPVNLSVLRALGSQLIDIHSQHATLQINLESFQRKVVDSVAENSKLLIEFQNHFQELTKLRKEAQLLEEKIAKSNSERDYFQFLYDELEVSNLQVDEDVELEEERQILENAELIITSVGKVSNLLDEQDLSVVRSLREASDSLRVISNYVPGVPDLLQRLESAQIEIKDISYEVSIISQNTNLDEKRLEYVNERISTLYHLFQKHQVKDVNALIGIKIDLEAKLKLTDNLTIELEEVKTQIASTFEICRKIASQLSDRRVKVLPKIKKYIETNLAHLGMLHAQFEVRIDKKEEDEMNMYGLDEIAFLFSANKGQQVVEIQNAASGGELSRIMLVVKSLIAETSALPTLIFDEIDTGISGEVALSVGAQIEQLSRNMQVIVISHLPQIASKGSSHFKVYKDDASQKTTTRIVSLDKNERIKEIAEMLSGLNPGEAALRHAESLLKDY